MTTARTTDRLDGSVRSRWPPRPSERTTGARGVLDLQRLAGNGAVTSALRGGPSAGRMLQRQTPAAGAPGSMTRARFVEVMRSRYGIGRVRAGTFAEQSAVNRAAVAGGRLVESAWAGWDPGESSEIYASILRSFGDFETAWGGMPPVDEVLFFATAYDIDGSGRVVPMPQVGADFGAGHLNVYRAGVDGSIGARKGIPVGRSTSGGRYPRVVATLGGRGTSPGAPIPLPSAEENTGRIVTHELGHGLAEQAMAADPAMFDAYRRAAGWVGATLFDAGIPEVRRALDAGDPVPATVRVRQGAREVDQPTRITRDDWNNPRWLEQPVSEYSVAGGAGEDFAEAVMTFVTARAVLAARSPARMRFLEEHRAGWLRFLRVRPPVGDFPVPARTQQYA